MLLCCCCFVLFFVHFYMLINHLLEKKEERKTHNIYTLYHLHSQLCPMKNKGDMGTRRGVGKKGMMRTQKFNLESFFSLWGGGPFFCLWGGLYLHVGTFFRLAPPPLYKNYTCAHEKRLLY